MARRRPQNVRDALRTVVEEVRERLREDEIDWDDPRIPELTRGWAEYYRKKRAVRDRLDK